MTTTIKKSVTTETEVEIKLPYYSKSISYFYKVVEGGRFNGAIQVKVSDNATIQEVHSGLAFGDNDTPCTEEEFETAFEQALAKLINRKNELKTK